MFRSATHRFLLVLFPLLLPAQRFEIPGEVRQGDVLHVRVLDVGRPFSLEAELNARKVPLFSAGDAHAGLMPVSVLHPAGSFLLAVRDASTGRTLHTQSVLVRDGAFPEQNISATGRMQSLKPLPGEMERVHRLQRTVSLQRHWAEPFLPPTGDCMNSPFGVKRLHNGQPSGRFHGGIDLRSPKGRPITAPSGGVVRIARMLRVHGGTVGIDHGQGLISMHLHMSRIATREGRTVKRGALLGYVGATGFATGPHLHWATYVHGVAVNPLQWSSRIDGCGGRSEESQQIE